LRARGEHHQQQTNPETHGLVMVPRRGGARVTYNHGQIDSVSVLHREVTA